MLPNSQKTQGIPTPKLHKDIKGKETYRLISLSPKCSNPKSNPRKLDPATYK